MDFYEKEKTDRFEIVAFHDGTVKNFGELDKNLEKIKKWIWKGRDLPFPVLLDATGTTIKKYGIISFPTIILIDPKGRLVGKGSIEKLKNALAKEKVEEGQVKQDKK